MEVKGTLLREYAELIKANPDRDWKQWLTDEDWEIVNGPIVPSSWYPFSTYQNATFAAFKELAGSNLDLAYGSGRTIMQNLLGVYGSVVVEGDPVESCKRLAGLRDVFMRGEFGAEVSEHGEGHLVYHWSPVKDYRDEEGIRAYAYHLAGSVTELTERAGGGNVGCEIKSTGREYWFEITWE